jgi:response regulator RpfG family c-di-GMP phosphodiesterase
MHGLWLAVTTTPDVIVSNVSHPERSSNYLLESLRRNPKTERIPIIALIPTITQRQAAVSCLRWATSTWLRSSNPTELAGEIERLIAAAERREAAVEWASIARRDAYFAQLGHEGVASPKLYTHSARKRRECHQ